MKKVQHAPTLLQIKRIIKNHIFIRLGSEQKGQNAENVILKKYHRIKMCQKK